MVDYKKTFYKVNKKNQEKKIIDRYRFMKNLLIYR